MDHQDMDSLILEDHHHLDQEGLEILDQGDLQILVLEDHLHLDQEDLEILAQEVHLETLALDVLLLVLFRTDHHHQMDLQDLSPKDHLRPHKEDPQNQR